MMTCRMYLTYVCSMCSILVGAPRDNVTIADAPPSVRQLVRPGVVYQCPITTQHDDCTSLRLDTEGRFTQIPLASICWTTYCSCRPTYRCTERAFDSGVSRVYRLGRQGLRGLSWTVISLLLLKILPLTPFIWQCLQLNNILLYTVCCITASHVDTRRLGQPVTCPDCVYQTHQIYANLRTQSC